MRNTFIKTIRGAILAFMLLPFLSFAQSSPSTAIVLQSTDTTITGTMPDTVLWFKFTVQTPFINAEIDFPAKNGSSSAYSLELLDNNLSRIEFNSDIENMQLIIYDIVGKEVLKQYLKHKSSTISIQSLKSGIYFYTLAGYGTETISGKIIKQ